MTDIKLFSRKVETASVGARGGERQLHASDEECAALAELLDLHAVSNVSATISLRRLASGLIDVRGTLTADVVQTCVVTLEPVPGHVAETFRVTYGDIDPKADQTEPNLAEIDIDFEEADPPEPIEDGQIDLGALVTEHLSLGLDPYPRKAGAAILQEYEPKDEAALENEVGETRKPFAGLDKLIK